MANRPQRRNPRRLAATQIAAMGTCEVRMLLDARHGEAVTPAQAVAREEGLKEHARFDQVVREAHNKGRTGAKPGPCFIASVAYGPEDARTDQLRRFRDQVLRRHRWGRRFVVVYYRYSPAVAMWLQERDGATRMVRCVLDGIRMMLAPWTGENDGREYAPDPPYEVHQL